MEMHVKVRAYNCSIQKIWPQKVFIVGFVFKGDKAIPIKSEWSAGRG